MWTLSGFADEISPELDVQLETLSAESIRYMEFRGVWNKNVLALTDAELATVKSALDKAGVKVSAIGSPIGKIKITDPMGPHLEAMRRAVQVARYMGAPYIRLFSFFLPAGEDPARYRDEVLDRMYQLVRVAAGWDGTLLHENEKDIYGDIPSRCYDLLTQINSPKLRAIWDAANFVQCGVRPFSDGYTLLRPYIEYVHVKDAVMATRQPVVAGLGDGEIRETYTALRSSGFDGFFSPEPHLKAAGPYSGFSGPELWRTAAQGLKRVLAELSIPWA